MFITVAKKDGRIEEFDCQKIISAITKSAGRVSVAFTKDTEYDICEFVKGQAIEYLDFCNKGGSVPVEIMHNFVEQALDKCNVTVANSYRHYRDSKKLLGGMFAKVCENIDQVQYRGDKSNANSDSKLLTTQRSIAYGKFNDERYKLFFLDPETREAAKDGYIYIHDRSARLDNMNCCLLDIQAVFKGGFEMGNIAYTEPESVDVAWDVMGDVIMAAASSQYGRSEERRVGKECTSWCSSRCSPDP